MPWRVQYYCAGFQKRKFRRGSARRFNQSDNKKFVHIAGTELVETIRWLRVLLRGEGVKIPQRIITLNNEISRSKSGVIVLGKELLEQGAQPLTEMLLWLDELNQAGRWYGLALSGVETDRGSPTPCCG